MEILIALLPPLFLGPIGIAMSLVGGTVKQQLIGEVAGAALIATAIYPWMNHNVPSQYIALAFVSGIVCTLGLASQIHSFTMIGVSRTMPVSTGFQLIYMALAGVILFNEWTTTLAVILGIAAIMLVIAGIYLTSYSEASQELAIDRTTMIQAIVLNGVGSILLAAYIILMRIYDLSFTQYFTPQAYGMLVGALLIASIWRDGSKIFSITTAKQIGTTGMFFGFGVALIQVATQVAGVATGFTLSQLGVVISVVLGITVLKEQKTSKEMKATVLGVALVLIGAFIMGYTKTL